MKIIPGTHLVSSYSKSRTFAGGRGEHIWHMLSGQLRGHEGSFDEQFPMCNAQCPHRSARINRRIIVIWW